MVQDLHLAIDLRVCPTVRESDGLALSSRNAYLHPSQRKDALILWHALKAGLDAYADQPSARATTILEIAQSSMLKGIGDASGPISLDYLEIVHPETLQPLTNADAAKGGILLGAFSLKGGDRTIRLIDNVILD